MARPTNPNLSPHQFSVGDRVKTTTTRGGYIDPNTWDKGSHGTVESVYKSGHLKVRIDSKYGKGVTRKIPKTHLTRSRKK